MTSTSSDSPRLGPVQPQERIVLLDVLRAFAILGMFYSNWGGMLHPDLRELDHGAIQGTVSFLRSWFIYGKFLALFALLMGAGMGVQIERALEKKGNIVPVYLRRLLSLLFLGWIGSIFLNISHLEILAASGFVVFFIGYVLRRHRIILLAVICWLFLADAIPSATRHFDPEYQARSAQSAEWRLANEADSRERSIERFERSEREAVSVSSPFLSRALMGRFVEQRLANPIPFELRSLENLVTADTDVLWFMLIGFFAWQVGLFKRLQHRRRMLIYLLATGVGVFLTYLLWVKLVIPVPPLPGAYGSGIPLSDAISSFLSPLSKLGLDLAYISAFALLITVPQPAKWLKKLAPAGRMAFTNYVLQWALPPILFPLLFGWWMPGITPAENAFKVTVVFILLVIFSTWWLKRFRFGPFEWLWRSLTYWKLQPMRVTDPS